MTQEKKNQAEFGDFQTPLSLARDVCSLIARTGFSPTSVLEPTCGRGAFIQAALDSFSGVCHVLGFDRDARYVQQANGVATRARTETQIQIVQSDFFETDWSALVGTLPDPILILGNPPWVTNATLGSLGSTNLPAKSNIDNLRGIDALTGKSNFDISEWMLRENLRWLAARRGMLAVLCKTTVARKVLLSAWSQSLPIESAAVYRLDAKRHFGASVDACLLLVRVQPGGNSQDCLDYTSLSAIEPQAVFGFRDGGLVAHVDLYERWHHLSAVGLTGWRSGIKHDCSKVFELRARDGDFKNGFHERVRLEPTVVFPLLKSSDLATTRPPRKWLLVPHRDMSASPADLQRSAPSAWQYLMTHQALLDNRGSSIYRNRPRFSIFGVGVYSFSSWKVAISGLYKKLGFVQVPPFQGRPVVLDDTCYFFSCGSAEECEVLHGFVTSEPAREFLSALIFWDSKRPITAQLLNSLDLAALARALGKQSAVARTLAERQRVQYAEGAHQPLLFMEDAAVSSGDTIRI